MARKIYCTDCSIYLGEISNGSKLRKGITFRCVKCEDTLNMFLGAEKFRNIGKDSKYNKSSSESFLNDLFKGFK